MATVVGLALLATACTHKGGTQADPPKKTTTTADRTTTTGDRTTTTTPSTTTTPGSKPIEWEDCDGGFECGTVEVPVDYTKPDGDTLDIAVTRRPAKDQSDRIGSLLMNPGGPGASAIDLIESIPLPTELTSTVSPIRSRARVNSMCHDVPNAASTAAAARNGRPSGSRISWLA